MSLPLDASLAAQLLHEPLLDFGGGGASSHLYAVLDMARGRAAARVLEEGGWEHRRLVRGGLPPALEARLPVVVQLGAKLADLEQYLELAWTGGLGVLLSSPLELEPMREHLAQQLIMEQEGQYFFFRFYDGRVALRELAGGTPGRLAGLFSRVQHLVAEPEGGAGAALHFSRAGQVHRWDLRWGLSLARCLGQDASPEALGQVHDQADQALAGVQEDLSALAALDRRLHGAAGRVEQQLKALTRGEELRQGQLTALADEQQAHDRAAEEASARQAELEDEASELPRELKELAGAMGANTLEVMTAVNRLRSEGARLKRARQAAEEASGGEVAELDAELDRVQEELDQHRATIEAQKSGAARHKELEGRLAQSREQARRQGQEAEEARRLSLEAGVRAEDLQEAASVHAQRREALEMALEKGDPRQRGGRHGTMVGLEGMLDAAARDREELTTSAEGLEGLQRRYNRAGAEHNLFQRMVRLSPEEQAQAEAAEQSLEEYARALQERIPRHRELAAACRARYQDVSDQAAQRRHALQRARGEAEQQLEALNRALASTMDEET